jgi:conjugal transfer/entry exclusion protein
MGSAQDDINVMELLLKISENVSAIKTDMANFKETYKSEKDNLVTLINDVRADAKVDLAQAKSTFQMELDAIKKVQEAQAKIIENQTKELETLKTAEDVKDAKKWRIVIAFILTAVGGFLMSYVFDFIKFVLNK